ncbi:MAG: hypothetical protein ACI9TH_003484 [Kiritimatiellia bacterium]|jgi:hypothetical protein
MNEFRTARGPRRLSPPPGAPMRVRVTYLLLLPLLLPLQLLIMPQVFSEQARNDFDPETNTQVEAYAPEIVLEGREGETRRIWSQRVAPEPILDVVLQVRMVFGGPDCYLLIRAGKTGTPLEHGKRMYLRDARSIHVGCFLNQLDLGELPLVVEVCNGRAVLEKVSVHRKR